MMKAACSPIRLLLLVFVLILAAPCQGSSIRGSDTTTVDSGSEGDSSSPHATIDARTLAVNFTNLLPAKDKEENGEKNSVATVSVTLPTSTDAPAESPTGEATPGIVMVKEEATENGLPDGPIGPFQLQLHWTPRSCWDDNCRTEMHWCMQCEGFHCNWGDIVWVEECRADRPPEQLFYWIPIPMAAFDGSNDETITLSRQQQQGETSPIWGQLQVRAMEWVQESPGNFAQEPVLLCLERWATRRYYLEYCSVARQQQWFHGLNTQEPFELYAPPLRTVDNGPPVERTEHCVKMHHHPRVFEEIIHTPCDLARSIRTHQWTIIMGDTNTDENGNVINSAVEPFNPLAYYWLGEGRRDPRCRPDAQCGMCQGHCQSSDDCAGSLECFQRTRFNAEETPPGCHGSGVPRMDYCYAMDGN